MPLYLVDMSLRSMGHDYAALWQALKTAHAQSVMDTTWMIDVSQDLAETTKALLSHLAHGDRLFVIEFKADTVWTATGLDDETKIWLRQRLPGVAAGLTPGAMKPEPRAS